MLTTACRNGTKTLASPDMTSTDTSYEYATRERAPTTPERRTREGLVVVTQSDMYSNVLLVLDEEHTEVRRVACT